MRDRKFNSVHAPWGNLSRCRMLPIWFLSVVLFCVPAACGKDLKTSDPHYLQAAYLFNIINFIKWPASSFTSTNVPIRIGFLGVTPVKAKLGEFIAKRRDKTIQNRDIVIMESNTISELASCHVIYFTSRDIDRIAADILSLQDSPVLTVGEHRHLIQNGAMIRIFLDDSRMAHEVNMIQLKKAGLHPDANMVGLSRRLIQADSKPSNKP